MTTFLRASHSASHAEKLQNYSKNTCIQYVSAQLEPRVFGSPLQCLGRSPKVVPDHPPGKFVANYESGHRYTEEGGWGHTSRFVKMVVVTTFIFRGGALAREQNHGAPVPSPDGASALPCLVSRVCTDPERAC